LIFDNLASENRIVKSGRATTVDIGTCNGIKCTEKIKNATIKIDIYIYIYTIYIYIRGSVIKKISKLRILKFSIVYVHDNYNNSLVQLSSDSLENYAQMQRSYLVKLKERRVDSERKRKRERERNDEQECKVVKRRYNGPRDRELITHKSQSNYGTYASARRNSRDLSLKDRHYVQSPIPLR